MMRNTDILYEYMKYESFNTKRNQTRKLKLKLTMS